MSEYAWAHALRWASLDLVEVLATLVRVTGLNPADAAARFGCDWRAYEFAEGHDHATTLRQGVPSACYLSGEPAQVALAWSDSDLFVGVPAFEEYSQGTLRPHFAEDPVRFPLSGGIAPDDLAEAIESAVARRRRTFRWCRSCRSIFPPESMNRGVCWDCDAQIDRLTLRDGL